MGGSDESLRVSFERRIGHVTLSQEVSLLATPTESILQAGLNMAVEGVYEYQSDSHPVHNTSAVAMLISWLTGLSGDLASWLSDRLLDMSSHSSYNKQRSCTAGLVSVVTKVLASSQDQDVVLCTRVEGTKFIQLLTS